MTLNCYVMPIVGIGTISDPRRPKYVSGFAAFAWGMFDYGSEPQCLVGVVDATAAVDSALTANNDVFAAPSNLDQSIGSGATLNKLRNGLEAADIPGTWLASTTTYRGAIRFVGACCQVMQRYQAQALPLVFSGTTTLDTTFGALPANTQQGLINAAVSLGLSTTAFVGTATLRTVIKSAADQYVAAGLPLTLASVAL